MRHGGEHLGSAFIGTAEHAHLSIGIGQGRGPFHGVISISGFVFEGIPLAGRSETATHVLKDYDVAVLSKNNSGIALVLLVVGVRKRRTGNFPSTSGR